MDTHEMNMTDEQRWQQALGAQSLGNEMDLSGIYLKGTEYESYIARWAREAGEKQNEANKWIAKYEATLNDPPPKLTPQSLRTVAIGELRTI